MWRTSCSLITGFVLGMGSLSAVASGGVSLVSQERSIEAFAANGDLPGTIKSATGFGRFHQSLHAELTDGEPEEGAIADATQDSTVSPSLLHTFSILNAEEANSGALASSNYHVTFDVTTPTPYHLRTRLTSMNGSGPAVDEGVRLHESGPSGPLVFDRGLTGDAEDHTLTATAEGVLAPGRYFFEADAEAAPNLLGHDSNSAQGTFSTDLSLGTAVAVPLPPAEFTAPWAVALVLGPGAMRRACAARRNRR
jgi:hypothetical protein